MAFPTLVLWCDATRNKLIQGWQSNQLAQKPVLKQGDSVGVEIHWVTFQGTGMPTEVIFPPSSNVTLAIGKVDASPTGGSYTLTYDGDTTAELSFDATATQVQAALNGLASITAEGGVTVERVGITNRIVWNDAGAYTADLTCDPDGLSPTTNDNIAQLREGTASVRRIILFSLKQAPIAACTSFSATPAPTLTVSNIYTNTWRLTLDGQPKAGSFKVAIQVGSNTYKTAPLSLFSSDADIAIALNSLLAEDSPGSFTAVSNYGGIWDVTAPDSVEIDGGSTGSVVTMTVEADIVSFSSLYGLLDMNTVNVEEFLSGFETRDAVLEIEVDASSEIQTIAQTPVTLVNDLISTSVFDLVSMGQVMPVDSVVRWDTPQVISSGGQEQARLNIGAADATDIAALEAEDIALDGRLDAVEVYLDQAVKTDSDVTFNSVTLTNATSGNALEYNPAGDGYKVFIDSTGNLTGKYVDGGVEVGEWGLNGEEGFFLFSGSNSVGVSTGGLSLNGSTSITFPDATVQTTAFIPADYLTASSIASTYLSQASASSTYLTQANAATTYGSLANTPTTDQKAALAAQSYSSTPPSSTNKYLTKSDFDANFITETHTIATNTGVNHSANDVIATGIIPNPDDTKSWLVTAAFNYATSDADLLSDVWWQSNNHELYFEEEGSLVGAQMTFARNSWQFILPAGVTGYEFWSSANAAFVGLSGQLVVCYKSV